MKNAHALLAVMLTGMALVAMVFILLLQIQTQPYTSPAYNATGNSPVDDVTSVAEGDVVDIEPEQENVTTQTTTRNPATTTATESLSASNTVFDPYRYTKYKSEYVPNDIYTKYPNTSTVTERIQKDTLTINGLQLQSMNHHFNDSQQKWVVRQANFSGENIPVSGMLTISYNFAVGGCSTYFTPDSKTKMTLPVSIEKSTAGTSDYFALGVKMETLPKTPCTEKLMQAEDPMTINGVECVFEVKGTIGEVSIEFFNLGIGFSGSTITFTHLTFPEIQMWSNSLKWDE